MSSLLNNSNSQSRSAVLLPAAQDIPIMTNLPTREETLSAINQMETNKAAGLDCAITAEALHNGGDAMVEIVHNFCAEVYTSLMLSNQWTTCVFVPLP